jgi:penicillin V acylase-like amidase (Ntn superfamily)
MLKKLVFCACLATTNVALACTAVDIRTKDGAVIAGRTMEWAYDMQWQLLSLQKGTEYSMAAPPSLKLPSSIAKTKYSIVGIGPGVLPGNVLLEGQNAAGLGMSGNFLPGFTKYQTVTAEDKKYVSILDFGTWALGSFASVSELKAALPSVKVWADDSLASGPTPPTLHFVFTDKAGDGAIVEYVNGKLKIYGNEAHTLTNAPTYDWHLTNLRNYLSLNVSSDAALKVGNVNVTELGQGGGMVGMPGDYTPPSRFVRSAFLRYYATPAANAKEGVQLIGHILNNVDIPPGVSVSKDADKQVSDFTQFVAIKDLTNNKMYVSDQAHRLDYVVLDLNKLFAQDRPSKVLLSKLPYPSAPDATGSLMN